VSGFVIISNSPLSFSFIVSFFAAGSVVFLNSMKLRVGLTILPLMRASPLSSFLPGLHEEKPIKKSIINTCNRIMAGFLPFDKSMINL